MATRRTQCLLISKVHLVCFDVPYIHTDSPYLCQLEMPGKTTFQTGFK